MVDFPVTMGDCPVDAVISKAKAELKAINDQLRSLNERKEDLARFLLVYDQLAGNAEQGEPEPQPRKETAKERILEAVASILADGKPRHTRVLLENLRALGIEVGGKDKLLALSALLSRNEAFEASRKVGWSIKSTHKGVSGAAGTAPDIFT